MRHLVAITLFLVFCVPSFVMAQKDTMKMGESFGATVTKAPAGGTPPAPTPVIVPPARPAPSAPVAPAPVKPLTAPPTVTASIPRPADPQLDGAINGELFASVKKAPGQIRDVVTFMAGWGGWGPTSAEFQPVVAPDLKVDVAGQKVPLKDARLLSARGYTTLRDASGNVTGARINQVIVKLARGFTRGSAQLDLVPRAGGYVVTAVTVN